jgi:Mrp family chromosome partitioning ATPase
MDDKCAKRSAPESMNLPQKARSLLNGTRRRIRKIEQHFEALRQRIVAAEPSRSSRNDAIVVALTARTRGEGVSTVALALARSFARHGDGRVLLIDADGKGNDLVRRAPGGMASIVYGPDDLNLEEEIYAIDEWDVDLLAVSGANGRLLDGPQWEDFFSAMRARYDVIVVDAGSLQQGLAHFWSRVASQVLLVVDSTRTTVQALERLGKELKTAKLALSGVVLNKREYPIPQFLY